MREAGSGSSDLGMDKAISVSPTSRAVRKCDSGYGAHFDRLTRFYANVVLRRAAAGDDKIATIVAGQRPNDLTRNEAIAYDVAVGACVRLRPAEVTYRQRGCRSERGA